MFEIFIKDHVNNKPVRQGVKNCIKTFKQLLVKFEINSVGIIKYLMKEPTLSENQYILTIQDNFSKYCVLVPVRQAMAEEVTRARTEKLICYFGSTVNLISDQGPHFMNQTLEEFARIFKINKFSTTAYHQYDQA